MIRQVVRVFAIGSLFALGINVILGLFGLPWWLVFPPCVLLGIYGDRVLGGADIRERRVWVDASILGAMFMGAQTAAEIRRLSGRTLLGVVFTLNRLEMAGLIVSLPDVSEDPTDDPGRLYFLTGPVGRQATIPEQRQP